MAQLKNKNLCDIMRALTQPVLGICLGMQILFARSFEGQGEPVECLGILPGDVKALESHARDARAAYGLEPDCTVTT